MSILTKTEYIEIYNECLYGLEGFCVIIGDVEEIIQFKRAISSKSKVIPLSSWSGEEKSCIYYKNGMNLDLFNRVRKRELLVLVEKREFDIFLDNLVTDIKNSILNQYMFDNDINVRIRLF